MTPHGLRPRFLVALLVVLALAGAWRFWDSRSHRLRFDGLYYQADENVIPSGGHLFQFYPDGTVLSCAYSGRTPADFTASAIPQEFVSRGAYELRDGWVQISLQAEDRTMHYAGEVHRRHIDFSRYGRYDFIRVGRHLPKT